MAGSLAVTLISKLDPCDLREHIGPSMNRRICIDPAICHGKPVIRGSRVLVSTVLGALAGGDSIETVLEDYPTPTREDIAACLEFAKDLSEYQVSGYEAMA